MAYRCIKAGHTLGVQCATSRCTLLSGIRVGRRCSSVGEDTKRTSNFIRIAGVFSIGALAGAAGAYSYLSQQSTIDAQVGSNLDASDPVHPYKRTVYIMRGVPCSGKSTVAHKILQRHLSANGISGRLDEIHSLSRGFILSTDDFFSRLDQESGAETTTFDMKMIKRNHERNRERCDIAMELGITPLIVDNTNTALWEMRAYVELAKTHGYNVLIKDVMDMQNVDLDQIKARLLARKSETGKDVPVAAVERMMKRYERLPAKREEAIELILKAEPPWQRNAQGSTSGGPAR
eukprot:TRINITY_DN66736_c0_g1_i1.p1 TRINITY_DN66736_c0_g1~~TRINITY_DN66736_c0_g1_i1.p1  ORF type:complete len:291 (-),score=28.26 TRINITY_DN66736_c0_g1_i1:22-894(-)